MAGQDPARHGPWLARADGVVGRGSITRKADMADVIALKAQLEQLKTARASGVVRLNYDGKSSEFRSDKDLSIAIRRARARDRPDRGHRQATQHHGDYQ